MAGTSPRLTPFRIYIMGEPMDAAALVRWAIAAPTEPEVTMGKKAPKPSAPKPKPAPKGGKKGC